MSEPTTERPTKGVDLPPGFPTDLPDGELKRVAAELAEGMRRVAPTNLNALLTYGELHEAARGELFRRALQRSERIARVALVVAIIASVASVASGIASIVAVLA
jgi:hypothetical protein